MPIYIALFRGINVAGNILPMTELVSILESLSCQNVKTYIQSGNAVFSHPTADRVQLSSRITAEIQARRGFESCVILLTFAEIEAAMAANPFTHAVFNPSRLHLGFLASIPKSPNLQAIDKLRIPSESYQLIDRVFYLYAPDGIGRSKLAASTEKLLGVTMTDRNWNTVVKLVEMAEELSSSGQGN